MLLSLGHCRLTVYTQSGSVFVLRNADRPRLNEAFAASAIAAAAAASFLDPDLFLRETHRARWRVWWSFRSAAGCVSRSRRMNGHVVEGSSQLRRDVTPFKRRLAWNARISRTTHVAPYVAEKQRRNRQIFSARRLQQRAVDPNPSLPLSSFLSCICISVLLVPLLHPSTIPSDIFVQGSSSALQLNRDSHYTLEGFTRGIGSRPGTGGIISVHSKEILWRSGATLLPRDWKDTRRSACVYPVSTDETHVGTGDNSNYNISFKHLSVIFLSYLSSSSGDV